MGKDPLDMTDAEYQDWADDQYAATYGEQQLAMQQTMGEIYEARDEAAAEATPGQPTEDAAAEAPFDFWAEVIGDDVVASGVVYDAREWTHDGEGGVRPLTPGEKAEISARAAHGDDYDHPDMKAALALLCDELDAADRIADDRAEQVRQQQAEDLRELDDAAGL